MFCHRYAMVYDYPSSAVVAPFPNASSPGSRLHPPTHGGRRHAIAQTIDGKRAFFECWRLLAFSMIAGIYLSIWCYCLQASATLYYHKVRFEKQRV